MGLHQQCSDPSFYKAGSQIKWTLYFFFFLVWLGSREQGNLQGQNYFFKKSFRNQSREPWAFHQSIRQGWHESKWWHDKNRALHLLLGGKRNLRFLHEVWKPEDTTVLWVVAEASANLLWRKSPRFPNTKGKQSRAHNQRPNPQGKHGHTCVLTETNTTHWGPPPSTSDIKIVTHKVCIKCLQEWNIESQKRKGSRRLF